MNDLTQKLIFTLVIVPVLFGIFRSPKEMMIAAGAISVALAFANLDKFTSFKGVGFEAKLRTAVDKAYAAIEQLKEVALSVTSPIVDEMAVSGRMFQYITLPHKLERVEKIEKTLKSLGASDKEIEAACSTIYERVITDHQRNVLRTLRDANPRSDKLFQGLDDGKMDGWNQQQIDNFIKEHSLKKTKDTEEAIADLEYFLKNRKLRREALWQS